MLDSYENFKNQPKYLLFTKEEEPCVIPTHHHIKQKLNEFNQYLHWLRLNLRPYCGKQPSPPYDEAVDKYFTSPEEHIKETVDDLPILGEYDVPDMEDGVHFDEGTFHYCFTLEKENYHPLAAIYFKIYPLCKSVELLALGVDSDHQRQGLASILLDVAIFISMLYGCKNVSLESTREGLLFYLYHGFIFQKENLYRTDLVYNSDCDEFFDEEQENEPIEDSEENESTELNTDSEESESEEDENLRRFDLGFGLLALPLKDNHIEDFAWAFSRSFPGIDFMTEYRHHLFFRKNINNRFKTGSLSDMEDQNDCYKVVASKLKKTNKLF